MRQLTLRSRRRPFTALLTGCCLSLSLLPALGQGSGFRIQDSRQTEQTAQGRGEQAQTEKEKGKAEPVAPANPSPPPEAQNPTIEAPSASGELPILLLVVQRPQGTPARKDDINASLSLMLRASVRESRKYQVILYSADHPSIRRALLEHSIAASELVEPIKAESLLKLARLIGARNILMVSSALEKVGLKTDVRLMQEAGTDTWITPLSQPFVIDAQMGKLRLKNEQMLALTVDNIDKYLGIPSHLADNIHLNKTVIIGGPKNANNNKKNARDKNNRERNAENSRAAKNTAEASNAAEGNEPATEDVPVSAEGNGIGAGRSASAPPSDTVTGSKNSDSSAGGTRTPDREPMTAKASPKKPTKQSGKNAQNVPKENRNGASQPPDNPDNPPIGAARTGTSEPQTPEAVPAAPDHAAGSPNRNAGKNTGESKNNAGRAPAVRPAAGDNRKSQPAMLTTDAGASLLAEPTIVPPVPPTDKVNHEAAADRYRQTGDLSNSIESLRQAINENPLDVHLRKKLILAYQDRQLSELAVSEIERAIPLAPGDPDLTRLHANSLILKGDVAGAVKMLREIITANPKDTAAQVALGDALLADSQFADAIGAFDAAAKSDPKSPLPHRRMARVLAARAGTDTTQYAACLQQIEQARGLTPPTDTLTYQGDYFEIMLLLESRLKDMVDQVSETYAGVGKRAGADLMQHATDLKERAEAASDFLDKLPAAAGQDVTHARYAQGAALLVQTIGYLRKFIPASDAQAGESLRSTRIDALTEFNTAHARLMAARANLDKGRAATGIGSN